MNRHSGGKALTVAQVNELAQYIDVEASKASGNWVFNAKGKVIAQAGKLPLTTLSEYALVRFGLTVHEATIRTELARKFGQVRRSPRKHGSRQNGTEAKTLFGLTALELLDKAAEYEARGSKDVATRLFTMALEMEGR